MFGCPVPTASKRECVLQIAMITNYRMIGYIKIYKCKMYPRQKNINITNIVNMGY